MSRGSRTRAEAQQVVVWRFAGALLALPVTDVQEVADTDEQGRAATRSGGMELTQPPGLRSQDRPPHAVVVAAGSRLLALPADAVEGVLDVDPAEVEAPPEWIARLEPTHVRALVRLGSRVAALLRPEALAPAG